MTDSKPMRAVARVVALAATLTAVSHGVPARAEPSRTGTGTAAECNPPDETRTDGVTVALASTFDVGSTVAFGLPLPVGAVTDPTTLSVTSGGDPIAATVAVLVEEYDASGSSIGITAVQVQLPTDVVGGECGLVDVSFTGAPGTATTGEPVAYRDISVSSPEIVNTAVYAIEDRNGDAALVTSDEDARTLFDAREPAVTATFPDGYLVSTGLFGHQTNAADTPESLAGLTFVSESASSFGLSAMYEESYPINADSVIDPTGDEQEGYEGWLYDRCYTFLALHAHTGDARFLREAFRNCSYYADHIELTGENRGIFTGKPEPDIKYSHVRGLYLYYALTGDEAALEAGTAIAERWAADEEFAGPYRVGHVTGPDNLWTERLLSFSIENLYFGHRLTGDVAYLDVVGELVATAHAHITGDADALATIDPDSPAFPPQNCFIHTGIQAAESGEAIPWCSGWMPALLVGPLLAYQDQTGDPRVDEIFIRLTRYLRDVGTSYFDNNDDNLDDTFLDPSVPSADPAAEDQRLLVPLYGAGLDESGNRVESGEFDDFQHCFDASAITAAGINALTRTNGFDDNPIGPFASEGESFVALHNELLFCAQWTFTDQTRPRRDPATWERADLAEGVGDPAFVVDNKIGFVSHNVDPERKISWWFNAGLEQFGLLADAGITIAEIEAGAVQPH